MQTNNLPIMVTVKCLVYNQALYLRQCLDGIINQKVNFRFEAIVHDDASTDGSTEILREYAEKYPDIIKPIFEFENQYRKVGFAGIDRIMDLYIQGKYIAFCEGDDYWTDSQKLQKQVDFLEKNPNYGLVYTQFKIYRQEDGCLLDGWSKKTTLENEFVGNDIMTLTTCFRSSLYFKYQKQVKPQNDWQMGDAPLWIFLLKYSLAYFMPESTSIYRLLQGTTSHPKTIEELLSFRQNSYEVRSYLAECLHLEAFMPLATVSYLKLIYILMISNNIFFDMNDTMLIRKYGLYMPKILFLYVTVRCVCLRKIIRRMYNLSPNFN